MRGNVAAVARPGVAAGLRIAGLEPVEAGDAEAAASVLEDLLAGDASVILIEEALWEELPREARDRVEGRASPLVMPFPSPTAETPETRAEAYLVEMLRRAVGYRVRLG